MKISATSALVLNWTRPEIWQSKEAQEYSKNLDLSEGDELYGWYSEKENYMHTQSVSNRKFFIRKACVDFLNMFPDGQVIIMAAGIAPMSIELASLFPQSKIFDVDKYLMKEKAEITNGKFPIIKFIECDITDISCLEISLKENGFDKSKPHLLVMEGITYYLQEKDLRNIITYFISGGAFYAGDFGLIAESICDENRIYGTEVFRKIKEYAKLDFVQFYKPEDFMKLMQDCGCSNARRVLMNEIQIERTGSPEPYLGEEPGWISLVRNF